MIPNRLFLHLAASIYCTLPSVAVAGFQFPSASQIVTNTSTAPDSTYTGAPDSEPESGAGTTWGGLGNGVVTYDFGTISNADLLLQAGDGILNVGGFDIAIYEANGGSAESQLIRVEVSTDGIGWTDITSTGSTVAILQVPQKDHPQEYTSSYDIAAHGTVARYLRITGTSSQPPGQTANAGNGFDLDAVAVAKNPRWDLWAPADFEAFAVDGHMDTVVHGGDLQLGVASQGNRLVVLERGSNADEPFRLIGEVQYVSQGLEILDAKIASGGGRVWLVHSHLDPSLGGRRDLIVSRLDKTGTGWRVASDGTFSAARETELYKADTFDIAVNDKGEPVVVAANASGANQIKHLNFVGVGPTRWNELTFSTVQDAPIFGAGSDSSPALAILPGDEVLVGMINVRLASIGLDSTHESIVRLMRVGYNASTGAVEAPNFSDDSTATVAALTRASNSAVAYGDLDLGISDGGRVAVAWRDRSVRRMTLAYQEDASDATDFEVVAVPSSIEGGIDAQVEWRGERNLSMAFLTQFPEENPYIVLASLDRIRDLWTFRGTFAEDVGSLTMQVNADGASIYGFIARNLPGGSFPVPMVPQDLMDFDGDGYLHIEEQAGLGRNGDLVYPTITMVEDGGDTFAEINFPVSADGEFYRSNIYTTEDFRYEAELGVNTGNFSDSFIERSDFFTLFTTRFIGFRSRLPADVIDAQYLRVRVSRP